MKILVLLLAIIVIALIVVTAIALGRAITKYLAERNEETGDWRYKERSLPGGKVGIFLISPSGDAGIFGEPISNKLPEYEFQERLEELRVGAQSRVEVLNRRLPE